MSHLKHKILVVDDHVVMREIVSDILLDQNYKTFTLESTEGAMELIRHQKISLILLDVNMPGENGYNFLMRLKKTSDCCDIPVIFMTGKDDIDDKIYGFELGAVDYIVKPFHRMDVLMRVKAHLKLVETHEEQKEKLSQLNKAHLSQMKLPEDYPRARFAVYFRSYQEAGGDFYDIIELSSMGYYAYLIADISGHDIATSYVMPAVKALLSELLKNMNDEEPLKFPMLKLNRSVRDILPDGKFITGQLILLNRRKGKVDIVNMGHTPLIYMPADEDASLIEDPGDILGVHDFPEFAYMSLEVNSFDRFVMYTDGLLESYEKRQIWTEKMHDLKSEVNRLKESDISLVSEALASCFIDGDHASDDVLILTIEV